ncbi:MAG TPA: hypothetical protein VK249_28210 [Anaerolineales bacterium]|nr:hypothetical protein [Anaerolineales bacterium]
MTEEITKERPKPRWLTILAGGYLVILCVVLFSVAGVFSYKQIATRNAPTSTAVLTPTPHMLVHQPMNSSAVEYEDFSSNSREWSLQYPSGKLQIINGKLILQSNELNEFALGTSRQFVSSGEKYYIQADFTMDTDKAYGYGLFFAFNESLGSFYLFDVAPTTGDFRLLKYHAGKWDLLVPYSQGFLNPYPEINTLSVYFDVGNIELYLNGNLGAKFSDHDPFRSNGVGVFVGNGGYRLIVDNFFVYEEK